MQQVAHTHSDIMQKTRGALDTEITVNNYFELWLMNTFSCISLYFVVVKTFAKDIVAIPSN